MDVTVRRATKADARRVAELAVRLVDQHRSYDERRFAKLYEASQAARFYGERSEGGNESAVFVAEDSGGEIVGMAFLEYEEKGYAEMLEKAAWLHDIYVDEAHRGTGAGRLLMDASIEWSKAAGADKLMLTVAARNEVGQGFFETRGFRPTMIEMMLPLEVVYED